MLYCSEYIFASKILRNETGYFTYTYEYLSYPIWLPESSISFEQINPTIDDHSDYLPSIFLKSQFPCYYLSDVGWLDDYIFERIFSDELGKDSCKGAELIQDSDRQPYEPYCNYTSDSGKMNCTIKHNGMYLIQQFRLRL